MVLGFFFAVILYVFLKVYLGSADRWGWYSDKNIPQNS